MKCPCGINLSDGGSAALKRLEDSTLSVSDLLKEKAKNPNQRSRRIENTSQQGETNTEDPDILGRLLQTNQKLCVMLEQRCTAIPPSPGTSFQGSFIFRDMLGREHVLEYRWFQHWEIFDAMLKCVFKDMPGEEYVELDKYLIFDSQTGGRPIDKGTWKRAIRPKSRIKMSIIISKQHLDNAQCPKCYEKCTTKCCSISTFTRW